MRRTCPVCRVGKIWRREVRTCSWHCSQTWRLWSPDQQANAIDQADIPLADIDLSALKPPTDVPHVSVDEEEDDSDTPDFLKDI